MKDIRDFFSTRDRFAKYVGIEIVEVSKGRAKVKLNLRKEHLNGVNIVHGAVLFALADYAFAIASNSHGQVALAINATISFLKAVSSGTIYAEAVELSRNPKLATYKIDVFHDSGDILAIFQGTVYIKRQDLKDFLDT
ncbi:PaaI family thioesterase [Desulfothermus naphthae]